MYLVSDPFQNDDNAGGGKMKTKITKPAAVGKHQESKAILPSPNKESAVSTAAGSPLALPTTAVVSSSTSKDFVFRTAHAIQEQKPAAPDSAKAC